MSRKHNYNGQSKEIECWRDISKSLNSGKRNGGYFLLLEQKQCWRIEGRAYIPLSYPWLLGPNSYGENDYSQTLVGR